jgi:biopolymer transport protein ExbB
MNIVRDNIITGNVTAARNLARNTDNPVARIIDKGIQRIGKPIDAIEKSMENVGRLEMYKMERNLNILSLIAGIAPMFGFLGTIVGMITLFYEINSTGNFELGTDRRRYIRENDHIGHRPDHWCDRIRWLQLFKHTGR